MLHAVIEALVKLLELGHVEFSITFPPGSAYIDANRDGADSNAALPADS